MSRIALRSAHTPQARTLAPRKVFFATYTPRQKTIKFICAVRGVKSAHVVLRDEFYFFAAVRGGKSATLFSTHVSRQKTIKFICAVRGVKLCEAFELFCRWRQQNALLAIFH